MNKLAPAILALSAHLAALAQASAAPEMSITRAGSQPAGQGSQSYFTGRVNVTPLFEGLSPSKSSAVSVSFERGARSAWHSHPAGQYLLVTAGVGRIQQSGMAVQEIRAGDVIWTPPGVKHWHGASAGSAVTHTAIQEPVNGVYVNWMEKVSDEQYAN